MLNSNMEWACVCVAQSCWLASILSNAVEAGNAAGPSGLVVHQACGFSLWLSLSLWTVLSLPMPWLWFLPTLHRMAIVISAIWLAPLPAAGAGVPEPGGLVSQRPWFPSSNTRALPTPSIGLPATLPTRAVLLW